MSLLMSKLLGQVYREGATDTPAAGSPPAATTPAATPPAPVIPQTATEPGSAPDKLPPPGLSDEAMAGLLDETPDAPEEPTAAPPKPGSTPPVPAGQQPVVPPVVPPVAAPTTPPATPQVPPPVAGQPPAAVVPPVATPPAATPPAAVTPPVATPPAPVAPVQSQAEIQAAQQARRQEYVTQVQKGYTFTEQEALELNANPAAALPKLAAKMHVDMLESAVHGIMMQVPQVLENLLVQRETTRRNEDEFYAAWPMIDRKNPEHRAAVNGILGALVQRNPSIARAEAMKQTGAAALVALGIPYAPPAAAPQAPVVPGQPQVPVAPPAAAAPPAIPPVVGFTPAVPGAGGQGLPGRAGEENPFSKMSREFEEDI